MGVSDERERIEVELVSGTAPDSAFARPERSTTSGVTGGPGDGPDRRVVVIATAVAVVALALGWILGRSASEGVDGPSAAGEVTAARTPATPIDPADATEDLTNDDGGDSVPSTIHSATTAAAATDPGDPEPDEGGGAPLVEDVDVAASLAGQPVEIVAYGNGQLLQRLDLTAGSLVTQRVPRQPFGRTRLIVGDEWVMFPPADAELPTIVVGDGGEITEGFYGPTWEVAGVADGAGLWVMSGELAAGGAGLIERVPISSGGAEELALPGPPSRFDPAGGFVVDAPGGSYRVTADGVSQITTGELIAIGREVALAEECDAGLTCSVVVIDRNTGERRTIEVARPLDDTRLPSIAIIGNESVSPDGARAMVHVVNPSDGSSGQPTIGVVDLATGDVVEIGSAQDIDQAVWSPDARFLFFNRGGKVVAYEPATGDSHVVADELIAIDAFGVRPLSPG